ncbi:MAG: GTPase ObgE [Weeping tea tree witches'-broom phytoplasma]|uniref:GTPase ObgE n=1 Tax=Candidatus Phytoplasma melaleucae TaxID=2982630 RepID=UPI00293A92F6|nr:GTPase ObgE [Weeping tea tree witches'-broom phytoplasma]
MNFIDETINLVQAGNGGNGKVAFRREKYVPYGGPSGGNGGDGGSVIFVGTSNENTLLTLKYQKTIKAFHGSNGQDKNKNGAKAPNLFIKVPLGVIVYDHPKNKFIGEILKPGDQLVIAKGGRGGRGNYSLANYKNKAPSFAEKGDLGENIIIKTELKILADVGLIGLPNVGKSSLISVLSNAKPKIDSYPFTTLTPSLGMVFDKDFSFVMADIPGLIKDASLGRGMGISFLKHIERCKLLVHICSAENNDIYQDYLNLNQELQVYNPKILDKPQIIVLNKMDLTTAKANLSIFKKHLKGSDVIPISVINKVNLKYLKFKIIEFLRNDKYLQIENTINHNFFSLEEDQKFYIYKDDQGYFVVTGKLITKLFNRTDLNNYESIKKFSYTLKKIGVEEELKKKGMKYNDQVKICDYLFEFIDDQTF